MKILQSSKSSLLLVAFVSVLMFSCQEEDPFVEIPEIPLTSELQVRTLTPEIHEKTATLHGQVQGLGRNASVSYGFIYFDIENSGERAIYQRVLVGTTEKPVSFSLRTVELLNNTDYIVCSFVVAADQYEMLGDEVPFDVPL